MKDFQNTHHRSFLLRLWCSEAPGDSEWRASLEIPETGKRIGFANLEQLFVYLMDLTECQAATLKQTGKSETRKKNQKL